MATKRQTKADSILSAARERRDAAKFKYEDAQRGASIAEAVFNEATSAYFALERSLAPTPRKKANKSTGTPAAQKELPTPEGEGPACVVCGHPEDYMDHTGPSPTKHDFEAPKTKKAAAPK